MHLGVALLINSPTRMSATRNRGAVADLGFQASQLVS